MPYWILIGLLLLSCPLFADELDQRQERLKQIRQQKLEAFELRQDMRLEERERTLTRRQNDKEREERLRVMTTASSRQRQLDRMKERSWHQIPHSGESAAIHPQDLPPLRPEGTFRGNPPYAP